MKKIINALFAVIFIATIAYSCDMLAGKKRVSYRRGTVTNRRLSPQARRIRKKALAPNSTARKKETQINKKLTESTQALEQSIEKEQKATNPTEKEIAKKATYELANDLISTLQEERAFINDLYNGYTKEQINRARLMLTKLYEMKTNVEKDLTAKEEALAKVTNAGYFSIFNGPAANKEQEYNDLSFKVTKLKNTLSRLDNAIADQRVIAGEKWSNAYKSLLGTGVVIAAAVAADIGLTGGATTMAIGTKAATLAQGGSGWGKQKLIDAWNMLPNLRSASIPSIEITPNKVQIDGKTIETTALESQFGSPLAGNTLSIFQMAKNIAMTQAISFAFSLALKKLTKLLQDPKTTPEQLAAQNKVIEKIVAQEKSKK